MKKIVLDDRIIRKSLICRLEGLSNAPKAILEELRVHNGNAIADVVTIHSSAHCYEIKGMNDNIHRILKQSLYYDLAFKKTTLVTTNNHLDAALRLAPPHWGVMLAFENGGVVKIRYIRSAKNSPNFDKKLALLTLWKSELVEVASSSAMEKVAKLNRAELSSLLASALPDEAVSKSIGEMLLLRRR